jgi:hypothetical protein
MNIKHFVKFTLILISFAFSAAVCMAQQPAYTILGEDQFRGIQIYDVIQDKDFDFWISTNEGVYRYNYTDYQKVDCSEAKNSAVFNFVRDKDGIIYCSNINNQIFKIQNKQLQLFYELKKEESSQDIDLAIGDDNHLLISSNQILALNSKGERVVCKKISDNYIGQHFVTNSKETQYHLSTSKIVISYSKGKFKSNHLNSVVTPRVLKIVKSNLSSFAFDLLTKKSYRYNPNTFTLERLPGISLFNNNEAIRVYESSYGAWMASALPGVHLLNRDFSKVNASPFFTDYFISDVYEDHEGNTLLSTFDKGIILIPSVNIPGVIAPFFDDPITAIHSTKNGLFAGSSKGKLLTYARNEFITLNKNWTHPIEVIKSDESGNCIVFDDGSIRLYNQTNNLIQDLTMASLKDAVFVNSDHFFLGTNQGVYEFKKDMSKYQQSLIPLLETRIHRLEYDISNKSLYVSTVLGLFVYTKDGQLRPIKFENNDLYPMDLYYTNQYLYVCTKDKGILVFKDDQFVRKISVRDNFKELAFKKILLTEKGFIGSTSNGIYLFDKDGYIKMNIHSNFGFSGNKVIDFTIHNDELWVSHSNGVQKVDLDMNTRSTSSLQLRFDNVLINNQIVETNELEKLSSSQRKIQFNFSTPTLRNQNLIQYHYRLVGFDTAWNINGFKFNQVTYNALSPGMYTFQLRVDNQGEFSPTKTIQFEILSPIYLRWWFILVTGLLFILLLIFIYRNQLIKQKRKSDQINELNASKLTAIQSQMNPHFIFNAMNSIQDLILKGNVEHSYTYITIFSNLVRKTLNYSEKDLIDFEQEIELLQLYLSLEKLRFKTEFHYTIDTNEISSCRIPPMLIQPFIENAIGHGLIHRNGDKILTISFELKDVLVCKIEDNGVGRAKAKEIKERQRADHESFSGRAIQNRFEILSKHYNGKLGFEYFDKMDSGESCGTIVYLKIPCIPNF